jgi:endonuclease/exonuclease/phosphatase family metal-dependent hydrolase
MRKKIRRVWLCALLMLSVTLAGFGGRASQNTDSVRVVTVMTYNVDEGTDLAPVLGATTLAELVTAVAEVYAEVQASNIPERAAGIARQIEIAHPDLIGLQEVSTWRTGPLGSPPATTVQFDALQSLLDELAKRNLNYAPIAISTNLDAEAPSALGFDVRLTDYDVVLARTDLRTSALKLLDVQTHRFSTNLTFTNPVLGTVTVPRGWISVDAKIRGQAFRFVTTHLESFSPLVQIAQANELAQGPGATELPVVFAGDFNSDAASSDPIQSAAYQVMLGAGFIDVWSKAHPGDPGFTWPLHGEDPFTPVSTPNQRIDLVLARGEFGVLGARLIGNNQLTDLTPSGLWPSDHAGVVAILRIGGNVFDPLEAMETDSETGSGFKR